MGTGLRFNEEARAAIMCPECAAPEITLYFPSGRCKCRECGNTWKTAGYITAIKSYETLIAQNKALRETLQIFQAALDWYAMEAANSLTLKRIDELRELARAALA